MDKIEKLVEEKMYTFLSHDPSKVEKDIFYMEATQIKLGMNYQRDRAIMKRVNSGQMIRMITLVSSNPVEMKKYLEVSVPEFSAVKQIEGK